MAVKLKKIKKRNPLYLNIVKWYLTQEKTGSVGIDEIAKEIEGRSALSLGDVQSTFFCDTRKPAVSLYRNRKNVVYSRNIMCNAHTN